jgi:hypothetical protein
MPFDELTKRTDANGRLIVEYDFGSANANREVRVSFDLLAAPHQYRGSRKHILDLVSTGNFNERMTTILNIDSVVLDPSPQVVPSGFKSSGEMDLDEYVRRFHGEHVAGRLGNIAGRNWWAPYGGTRPKMDLICKARIGGQAGLLFVNGQQEG